MDNYKLIDSRKENQMNECFNCMYMHPDWDVNGNVIRPEYCHYVGPDEWAPCAEEEYELELDPAEDWLAEEFYNNLFAETLNAMSEPTFEEYGAPYDYKEF